MVETASALHQLQSGTVNGVACTATTQANSQHRSDFLFFLNKPRPLTGNCLHLFLSSPVFSTPVMWVHVDATADLQDRTHSGEGSQIFYVFPIMMKRSLKWDQEITGGLGQAVAAGTSAQMFQCYGQSEGSNQGLLQEFYQTWQRIAFLTNSKPAEVINGSQS